MKFLKLVLLIVVFVSCKNTRNEAVFIKAKLIPSNIDSINSTSKIEGLVRVTDTNFKEFKLRSIQDYGGEDIGDSDALKNANKLKVNKTFYKEDFDNNGYTDLLVIGGDGRCSSSSGNPCDFCSLVVMNYDNTFKIRTINKAFFHNSFVPKITYIKKRPLLLVYNVETVYEKKFFQINTIDTLQFKFDNFIEYQDNVEKFDIEKIEYSTTSCLGTCPVFKIDINKNREAKFRADAFNFTESYSKNMEGYFKTTITAQKNNEIINLLNFIKFPDLKNNYAVFCTDLPSCSLKITYNGGKVKTISDYGKFGTYGLKLLYKKISDLRFNQKWTKI